MANELFTKNSSAVTTPLVSVIVPLYNAENYIEMTLRSILRQTYPHFEVIVVDDGSQDSSAERVERLNDPRIRLIRQKNQGVSKARNNGFLESKGEYIAFLDSDDVWFPEKLEQDIATIRRHDDPVCLVYSGFYCIDEKNRLTNIAKHLPIQAGDFQSVIACNIFPSIAMVHRNIMVETGGFPDAKRYPQEDRVFFVRVCKQYNAYPTGRHLVLYRQMMTGRALQKLQDYDAMLAAELSTIEAMQGYVTEEELQEFRHHHLRSLLNRLLRFNAFENAKKHAMHVPVGLLTRDPKGWITLLSLVLNVNLLHGCQVFLFIVLKYTFAPWWYFKRRAAIG
jgi:glycosyltransferase involved in cell wall biosynthesis